MMLLFCRVLFFPLRATGLQTCSASLPREAWPRAHTHLRIGRCRFDLLLDPRLEHHVVFFLQPLSTFFKRSSLASVKQLRTTNSKTQTCFGTAKRFESPRDSRFNAESPFGLIGRSAFRP